MAATAISTPVIAWVIAISILAIEWEMALVMGWVIAMLMLEIEWVIVV
jgi:hypothetical protein